MKKIYFIFLLMAFGCSESGKTGQVPEAAASVNILEIELKDLDKQLIDTSLIKTVTFIPLETNKECMIGEVDKLLYKNNQFFIYDEHVTKSVFVFDDKGKYLYKVNRLGNGPGEYAEPMDMDLDDQGNIHVWDNGSKKMIKYRNQGTAFEETASDDRFLEFAFLDDKTIFNKTYESGKVKSNIVIHDPLDGSKKAFLPVREFLDELSVPRRYNYSFFRSDNTILYYHRFSDDIYKIDEKGFNKYIKIKSDLLPPVDYVKENKENPNHFIRNMEYIKDIGNLYETKDFLVMNIDKFLGYNLVVSKNSNQKRFCRAWGGRSVVGIRSFCGVKDNTFLSVLSPSEVTNERGREQLMNSELNDRDKKMLLSLNESQNPVIVISELKSF